MEKVFLMSYLLSSLSSEHVFGRRVACMLRRPKSSKMFVCLCVLFYNIFTTLILEHVPIQEKLAASGKTCVIFSYFDSNTSVYFIVLIMH